MAPRRKIARFVTVMAAPTVRIINLVVPLAHKATAMRTTETAGSRRGRSGAVTRLIGDRLRPGDVDSTAKCLGR